MKCFEYGPWSTKYFRPVCYIGRIIGYDKLFFETAYLGENIINLFQQKAAQNVAISLGYFIFSKNQEEPPKLAQ